MERETTRERGKDAALVVVVMVIVMAQVGAAAAARGRVVAEGCSARL